ncbi:MAG: hypothetical protein OK454_01240, partial [Thaumarchaeota archaeon]|nr:hypothetical protein [Nitrososphaerota archaeon]
DTEKSGDSANAKGPAVVRSPPSPHLRPPLPPPGTTDALPSDPEIISLRPVKEVVRSLTPDHPLRIVLLGEPDEMPRAEYGAKLMGWFRLLHSLKV